MTAALVSAPVMAWVVRRPRRRISRPSNWPKKPHPPVITTRMALSASRRQTVVRRWQRATRRVGTRGFSALGRGLREITRFRSGTVTEPRLDVSRTWRRGFPHYSVLTAHSASYCYSEYTCASVLVNLVIVPWHLARSRDTLVPRRHLETSSALELPNVSAVELLPGCLMRHLWRHVRIPTSRDLVLLK